MYDQTKLTPGKGTTTKVTDLVEDGSYAKGSSRIVLFTKENSILTISTVTAYILLSRWLAIDYSFVIPIITDRTYSW